MASVQVPSLRGSFLLRLPAAVPWIAIMLVAGSLYAAWLDHFGTLQRVGAAVIACCGLLTLACRSVPFAAILISAAGGGVALALTSREYFAFWAAATALLITSAVIEAERGIRRVPRAAAAAAVLGLAGALLGPAHDGVPPLWPIAVAALAVVLIELLVNWAAQTRRLEQQASQYLHRAQASEAEATQLARRTALAQELHDSLSHHIAAIVVQAEAGHVAREHEALTTIADLAREALRELEVVLFDLRTPSASESATPEVDLTLIDTKLAALLRHDGTIVQVEVTTTETDTILLAAIYRIAQEALTNILRHAHATNVSVIVQDAGGDIHVRIQDNGVGIDPSATVHGMGVSGMRDRAARLGGETEIGPAEPHGTLVHARIPRTDA